MINELFEMSAVGKVSSEEAILNKRGYTLDKLLGEGSYAKVFQKFDLFLKNDFIMPVSIYRYISQNLRTPRHERRKNSRVKSSMALQPPRTSSRSFFLAR